MDTKPFLEYLDKEMSIMGILSAVSVLAPGGILSSVLANDKSTAAALWNDTSVFIVAGSTLCIIAGLCFYKQRANLAWFYGQICLDQALTNNDNERARQWLQDADSWEVWWLYSWGFTFLAAGFVEYFLAVSLHIAPQRWCWL